MKKIICLLTTILLCVCLVSCGKSEGKKPEEETVDLEYFVRLGKIPECDYTVGVKGSEILENEGTEENEGFKYICIAYNNVNYYYEKENEDDTVTHIVSYNGAYGFTQGASNTEIKQKLSKGSLNAAEEELTEDDTFFIPINGKFTGIKYTFGDYTTCFVFDKGTLCACSIYRS